MIHIDSKKCTNCGACADVCPELVIENGEKYAEPVHNKSCLNCYHCVAVCPVEAVTCDEFELSEFEPLSGIKAQPTPAAMRNMMTARRSVREFKDKPIPREVLEELVQFAAIAPTGHNAQAVSLSVITDRKVMDKVDGRIMDTFQKLISVVTNPVGESVVKTFAGRKHSEKFMEQKETLDRFQNAEGIKRMHVFRGAPALIVAHCGAEALTGKDDCIIALSQIMMLAQTMGIGSTWIGYLVGAANVNPTLKKPLGVPLMHPLHGAAIFGWPKYKYKRAIPRKPLAVKWID